MFNLLALQSQQGPRSNIVQGSYNSEVVRQYYYIVVEDKHAYCLEGQIAYLDVPIKQYTHSCYVRQEPGAGVVQSASHVPRNYLAIAIGRQTDSNVYSFMVRLHVYTRWTSDVTPPRSVARAKLVRRGTVGRGLWEGDCGKGTVGRGLWEGDCGKGTVRNGVVIYNPNLGLVTTISNMKSEYGRFRGSIYKWPPRNYGQGDCGVDFLRVDGQSINEIFRDLKSGQSNNDREERREIKGDKLKARDTAFKLLYLILLRDSKDEMQGSAKVFNAVLYLISHAATFKWRTRSVVRAAYEERFVISTKQTAGLDKQEKKDTAK